MKCKNCLHFHSVTKESGVCCNQKIIYRIIELISPVESLSPGFQREHLQNVNVMVDPDYDNCIHNQPRYGINTKAEAVHRYEPS